MYSTWFADVSFNSEFSNFVNYLVNEKLIATDPELDDYLKLLVKSV